MVVLDMLAAGGALATSGVVLVGLFRLVWL